MSRLGQLKALRAEAELVAKRIEEIEMMAHGITRHISGMPRGNAVGDPVGRFAAELADLRDVLEQRQGKCLEELKWLYGFIDRIDDSTVRQIFVYRYVDGLTWQRVAYALNEFDEQYPRRRHNQYLRKNNLDENDGRAML